MTQIQHRTGFRFLSDRTCISVLARTLLYMASLSTAAVSIALVLSFVSQTQGVLPQDIPGEGLHGEVSPRIGIAQNNSLLDQRPFDRRRLALSLSREQPGVREKLMQLLEARGAMQREDGFATRKTLHGMYMHARA